jgi:flagellum-specific ATP synthase
MSQVISKEHMMAARALKASMARHDRVRDLIPLGAYVPGADPVTDKAVQLHPRVEDFLCQGTKEEAPFAPCVEQLEKLMTS